MASQYDLVFIVGEDIDLLVRLTGLAPRQGIIYLQKCERGKAADILYSTTSFKYSFANIIDPDATTEEVANAGETFLVEL